jgi:hypothetical protein
MADTIGDLIDKLTIANIKLWHIEDERREFVEIEEKEQTKGKAVKFLNMISDVNKERNSLIDQINMAFRTLSNNEEFKLNSEHLLGTGKNKFYK